MANKTLFKSSRGKLAPKTDTTNKAGGKAYKFPDEHVLAQAAMTGCMGNTFYASAKSQLDDVLNVIEKVPPEFVAKTALYARQNGFMKDMPTVLLAWLSKHPGLFKQTYPKVVDGMKMLRNFVQVIRSGAVGRKSMGTSPRNMVRKTLDMYSDQGLFVNSVGQNPSLPDIIKMVHPKPNSDARKELYAYLIGKPWNPEKINPAVVEYENFKATKEGKTPDVPFQMLSTLKLEPKHWREIAVHSSWHTLRMNLNKFGREGVFKDKGITEGLANRLCDPNEIKRAKVFPYQIMMAFNSVDENVPRKIQDALQDAMEIALVNVPKMTGNVFLFPDVSGSMSSPITGARGYGSSKVRCIDVAAMFSAALAKVNPQANIIPFESDVVPLKLNTRDSVMTMAQKMASVGGGGTNASAALRFINQRNLSVDMVVYVSDNESWIDSRPSWGYHNSSGIMSEWSVLKTKNPKARMVCIDLTPNQSTQAPDREDILNVGGFSDSVFKVIDLFAKDELNGAHWVGEIGKIAL